MRPIDAEELIRSTINNPLHVPYITKTDVEAAPTLEIEPQWIPCSERLPKHDETVLVWYCNEIRIGYLTDISETDFSENCVWVLHGSFPFKHDEKKVVAWMPLPEPYEAEE